MDADLRTENRMLRAALRELGSHVDGVWMSYEDVMALVDTYLITTRNEGEEIMRLLKYDRAFPDDERIAEGHTKIDASREAVRRAVEIVELRAKVEGAEAVVDALRGYSWEPYNVVAVAYGVLTEYEVALAALMAGDRGAAG